MVGQLIEGFHPEQPRLQVADYSLLFLAGPSPAAFQSLSKHVLLQATGPAALPELMGLGLSLRGLNCREFCRLLGSPSRSAFLPQPLRTESNCCFCPPSSALLHEKDNKYLSSRG